MLPQGSLKAYIIIETLAISVQSREEDIKGIKTLSNAHKLLFCVNDAAFILQESLNSLKALNFLFTLFSSISGYKINKAKSTIMGLNTSEQVKRVVPEPWKTVAK